MAKLTIKEMEAMQAKMEAMQAKMEAMQAQMEAANTRAIVAEHKAAALIEENNATKEDIKEAANYDNAIRVNYEWPEMRGTDDMVLDYDTPVFSYNEIAGLLESVPAAGFLHYALNRMYFQHMHRDEVNALGAYTRVAYDDIAGRATEKRVHKPRARKSTNGESKAYTCELNTAAPELAGFDIRPVARGYMLYKGKAPVVRIMPRAHGLVIATRLNIKTIETVDTVAALAGALTGYLAKDPAEFK